MGSFYCTTQIISGPGSLQALKTMDIQRLLLVTDPYFVKSGDAQRLLSLSGAAHTQIFDQVTPDPSVELAARGTAVLRSFQPDTVVALGGGSTIDCAKAMVYFSEQKLPLVAVPTTSGSGSEVTDFAVLTHGTAKHPLVDPAICPKVAILDSELLENLPPKLIADTGFDVLAHALEAYVATNASGFTDALASQAFGTAFCLLSASYGGDTRVRQRLHEASAMAGLAFTRAGLGLCHAMAHSLGGIFHLPHGRLNAILLPEVIAVNSHSCLAKYARLARAAGISGAADTVAVRNLMNALVSLRRSMGLPQSLTQAGIAPQAVWQKTAQVVADTLADPCCATNPLGVREHMVRRVLEEVTGRG